MPQTAPTPDVGDKSFFDGHHLPRRDAVFVSAGDRHLLDSRLNESRDFDLVIAWYGSDTTIGRTLRDMADLFFVVRGGKFQNLWTVWKRGDLLLDQYDSVFVADDDVALSPSDIERLFQRRRKLDAWILTPSHARWGQISHSAIACRPTWDRHYTNFVEVNTPVFHVPCLVRFLHEFDGSLSGWGIDHWYMTVLGESEDNRYVVDDSVVFCNPRTRSPGGGREIDRFESRASRIEAWERVRDSRGIADIDAIVLGFVRSPLRSALRRALAYGTTLVLCSIAHPISTSRAAWLSIKLQRRKFLTRMSQRRKLRQLDPSAL